MGLSGRAAKDRNEPQAIDLTLVDPIHEYNHSARAFQLMVIGEWFIRNDHFPRLRGLARFGDWVTGSIWALSATRGKSSSLQAIVYRGGCGGLRE